MLQPESAGDAPFGPVSWYGVARPCALSGSAGTMMSQSVLSAAACAGAADPDADGHGAAAAEADAGALAAAAGALAAAAGAAWLPLAAGAAPLALAAAEAQEPRADCSTVVVLLPETARMIPRVRPSAIGMARGTAMRAARLLPRRRHADLCPLSIQSTSMMGSPL
jgi:hypothetical protein